MAQPMPTPIRRNRSSVHKMYFTRSIGRRRPRKPKAMEITKAKTTNAWKWLSYIAIIALSNPIRLHAVIPYDLVRLHKRATLPAN